MEVVVVVVAQIGGDEHAEEAAAMPWCWPGGQRERSSMD
jgi:hypothetical protein